MKNKKIIFIIIAIILIIFIIYKVNTSSNKTKTSVDDFKNVKEICEYYGCKYIDIRKSSQEGYSKDIYLNFNIPPISNEGITNKYKYEQIISVISSKMNSKDYRIIDEQSNILINLNFTADGAVTYSINNDKSFFEHLESKFSIVNAKDDSITNFNVNSRILYDLINNNWKTTGINIGTRDSNIDKYDIFFDEGYKIRKVNGRVYNIIFTKQYKDSVINDLHTDCSLEELRNALGKETYASSMENANVIGYKNNIMYAFFTNDEISIYPNEEGRDSDAFASVVSSLIESNDKSEFISKLTDIWPDYSNFIKTENYTIIEYPLKGIKIDFTVGQSAKIYVYGNYKGKITNDISIDDVKNNKSIPASYIELKLNENLLTYTENRRASFENRKRNPYNTEATLNTNYFAVYLDEEQNRCEFYSRNRDHIDSNITLLDLNNIYDFKEGTFIYSIKNKGIYLYDAVNITTNEVIIGEDNFEIKKIKNNIIYYDDKKIEINI